jgi:[ribosomal protein S5]-alanine N-acetyltransferase
LPASYFLRTNRLGFRNWSAGDLPFAIALWGDPEVTRWIGGPFSEDEVRARLEREIALQATHGVQYWPMFMLADEDFVGCAGLRPYKLEQKIYEIGFHLRPAHWHKGLAGEAARGIIAHAFGRIGANALFAGHHPANAASRHVLEKLGFRFTHEELYPPTGLNHPSYLLTNPAAT